MFRRLGLLIGTCLCLSAQAAALDFEGWPDGTLLAGQYASLTFSNAVVLEASVSLNEFEFPPHSGANVVSDSGGAISIAFATPVLSFSAWFTYAEPLVIQAFDPTSNLIAVAASAFSSNLALSGDVGSAANESIGVIFPAGISMITITGDPAGGSFVMDDVAYTALVPEPSPLHLSAVSLLVFLLALRIRSPIIQDGRHRES